MLVIRVQEGSFGTLWLNSFKQQAQLGTKISGVGWHNIHYWALAYWLKFEASFILIGPAPEWLSIPSYNIHTDLFSPRTKKKLILARLHLSSAWWLNMTYKRKFWARQQIAWSFGIKHLQVRVWFQPTAIWFAGDHQAFNSWLSPVIICTLSLSMTSSDGVFVG